MQPQAPDAEPVSVGDVMENTWDRQRTTEELMSFIIGRQALLEDVELGI